MGRKTTDAAEYAAAEAETAQQTVETGGAANGTVEVKQEQRDMGAAPEENKSGFYCYIGPNLKKLIQTGTIYRGTRKDALDRAAEAIKAQTLVKTLIVSGDALPAARLKVKTPGNVLYANYQKLLGAPAETQRSGFGGERRSKGAGEDLAERRGQSQADFATTRKE